MLEPSVLGPLLNDYLTGMTDIVLPMMAQSRRSSAMPFMCYSAPRRTARPCHARNRLCIGLDDYAQSVSERYRQKGLALGATRIGVHAGPAIVVLRRKPLLDYTAMAILSMSPRLEARTKLGTRICVSAPLASKVDHFQADRSATLSCAARRRRCARSNR